MLRLVFCIIFATISLFGQVIIHESVKEHTKRIDLKKDAALYICNVKTDAERERADAFAHAALSKQFNIDFYELDTSQYEILCEMTGLYSTPNEVVFVLYHNKKSVQFPFDTQKLEPLEEFKKLGWIPLEERLEAYLKRNPNNQDVICVLLDYQKSLLSYYKYKTAHGQDKSLPPSFLKTIIMINNAGSADWMNNFLSIPTGFEQYAYMPSNAIIKDTPEFQREMNKFLKLIESEIVKNPYQFLFYIYWSTFAGYTKKPDPWKLLSQINFPIVSNKKVLGSFGDLADPLFLGGMVDEGFKFLDDAEKWMETQDIPNGTNFDTALLSLATNKIGRLIGYGRHSDLEKYLRDIRYKLGSKWPECVEYIKEQIFAKGKYYKYMYNIDIDQMPNRKTIEEIMELPPIEASEKYFNSFIILHNFTKESSDKLEAALSREKAQAWLVPDSKLPQNHWTLKNANVFVASGSVVQGDTEEMAELMGFVAKEGRKYLKTLEKFIRLHPENFEVMDMYCEEAAKYLPDEELENNIYAYSSLTGKPPASDAYSKMEHKTNWSNLASKMVAQGLIKLKDFCIAQIWANPWSKISGWEDINTSGRLVDWYSFVRTNDFFYDPMYYTQRVVMPSAVFIKFIKQAEIAGDWEMVLNACEARFDSKAECKNEQILQAWSKAEEKLKKM